MRTEDDKKDHQDGGPLDKDRNDSPGEMVIDEDKHDGAEFQPQAGAFAYHNKPDVFGTANDSAAARNSEPKPLLSAQYEPLSDED